VGDLASTGPDEDPAEGADRDTPGRFVSTPAGWDIERLRQLVRTGSPVQRAAAIAAARPAPGVEEVLVEALDDPEVAVRVSAVRTLAGAARSRGTGALIRVTSTDPAPQVRAEAVAALAQILDQRIGPEEAEGVSGRPV
jgi:hypothetical protein